MKLRNLILILAAMLVALTLRAASGTWTIPAVWSPPPQQIVVTPGAVYYLSGGSLFSHDTTTDEALILTADNRLSSAQPVTGIYYNEGGRYLAATYADGTIDLLYDNGRNVTLPDIAQADLSGVTSRGIRCMTFDNDAGLLYAGTDFGLVVFNDRRHEVVTASRLGTSVNAIALSRGNIILHADHKIWGVPATVRINSMDALTYLRDWYSTLRLETLNPATGLIAMLSEGDLRYNLVTLLPDVEAGTIVTTPLTERLGAQTVGSLHPAGEMMYYTLDNRIYSLSPEGVLSPLSDLPDELEGNILGTRQGTAHIYGMDMDGLIHMGLHGDRWTVLGERYAPATMPVRNAVTMSVSPDGRRLYVGNLGPTNYRMGYITGNEGRKVIQTTGCIDLADGTITDVTAYPAPAANADMKQFQRELGEYVLAPTHMCEDPDDPDIYWIGTGHDGLLRIVNGQLDGRYDPDNAPFVAEWGCRVYDVSTDRGGNLWVLSHNGSGHSGISVLPADKRRLHPDEVSASDWILVDVPDYQSNKDVVVLHCRRSPMIFITDAGVTNCLVAIDTRGTFNDLSDDVTRLWTTFVDQDGKSFSPDRHASLCEDADGRVWLGTNAGIVSIHTPTQATDPSMRITRVKVPRNDGTNTADYLASSDLVLGIAVDAANRKWLATDASGVMLVSSSGDAILSHFTPDNSGLPSSRVNAVNVSPYDGTVRFATESGLAEYIPGVAAAGGDGSSAYAYPNPVRPDYGGHLTVAGLADGALVKFADASGHVLYQTRASGGEAVWDLCSVSGRRVPSGVYYVLSSSTSGTGEASAIVCKFLVVN